MTKSPIFGQWRGPLNTAMVSSILQFLPFLSRPWRICVYTARSPSWESKRPAARRRPRRTTSRCCCRCSTATTVSGTSCPTRTTAPVVKTPRIHRNTARSSTAPETNFCRRNCCPNCCPVPRRNQSRAKWVDPERPERAHRTWRE